MPICGIQQHQALYPALADRQKIDARSQQGIEVKPPSGSAILYNGLVNLRHDHSDSRAAGGDAQFFKNMLHALIDRLQATAQDKPNFSGCNRRRLRRNPSANRPVPPVPSSTRWGWAGFA